MKILHHVAVRAIPVAALAFVITAAIAYQRGVYDFTFIERPTSESTAPETEAASDSTPETSAPDRVETEASGTTADEATSPPVETDPVSEFLSSLPLASSLPNWDVTDKEYRVGMRLAIVESDLTLESSYSISEREVTRYERIPSEVYGGYVTESRRVTEERPLVESYMDYILVDNGSDFDILSRDGSVLAKGIDLEYYQPAYTRDSDDIPQFKVASGVKDGEVTYKYYMLKNGRMVESDYDDAAEGRGLYYNYPSYFGKSDSDVEIVYRNGSYTLARGGSAVTYRNYVRAFNYSEGLAAVVRSESLRPEKLMLVYLNTHYYDELYCMKGYWNGWYYNDVKQRVAANYRLPDTYGEESIGFFYFDHGLCRVRKQEHNYYWTYQTMESDRLMSDEDLVIRSDGTLFEVPGGYNVVNYSSGVLVLERDGLYGAYDYTGDFILAPDYDYVSHFSEGLAVVSKDGLYGVVDSSGNSLVPLIFDYIQPCSSGIICAYSDSCGWAILGKLA